MQISLNEHCFDAADLCLRSISQYINCQIVLAPQPPRIDVKFIKTLMIPQFDHCLVIIHGVCKQLYLTDFLL